MRQKTERHQGAAEHTIKDSNKKGETPCAGDSASPRTTLGCASGRNLCRRITKPRTEFIPHMRNSIRLPFPPSVNGPLNVCFRGQSGHC